VFYTSGWLHVICGCMFCGKTDEALRLLRRFSIAGRQVILIKPRLDTRTDEQSVISRSGANHPAVSVGHSREIEEVVAQADIVAIEEGQFFDDALPEVVERLADAGKQVLVTGLDRDFRGIPFGPMPRLIALADQVTKLTAICVVCGEPATRTQRLIDGQPAPGDSPLIVIGGIGDATYEARGGGGPPGAARAPPRRPRGGRRGRPGRAARAPRPPPPPATPPPPPARPARTTSR
jgi:thymidine kinase